MYVWVSWLFWFLGDGCENFWKENATYEWLLGSVEEMDVSMNTRKTKEKNSIVDAETGQSHISSPGSHGYSCPALEENPSFSPFLVLLSLKSTKRDGIQFTAGLRAVDSQLWVGKKWLIFPEHCTALL